MIQDEARMKLAEYLHDAYGSEFSTRTFQHMRKRDRERWLLRARSLEDVLASLGYVHTSSMKLLTTEQIDALLLKLENDLEDDEANQMSDAKWEHLTYQAVAQAQLNQDRGAGR